MGFYAKIKYIWGNFMLKSLTLECKIKISTDYPSKAVVQQSICTQLFLRELIYIFRVNFYEQFNFKINHHLVN